MAVVCEMLEKSYCDRVILASLKKSHSDVLIRPSSMLSEQKPGVSAHMLCRLSFCANIRSFCPQVCSALRLRASSQLPS